MSRRLKIAVMLHPGADGTAADTREQARHAERLGLDGIFVSDHPKPVAPTRRAWSYSRPLPAQPSASTSASG
jgi:alkanesulfonate monooxygenase SsuD/methylene tetrahydromethanopterin reductase-like flavin-dependent oxidoreductase (luciferase family)